MTFRKIKFPSEVAWSKLLLRWSDFPPCGEKKLIAAIIAAAIVNSKEDIDAVANRTGFFGTGLDCYCNLIHLNAQFVCDMVLLASGKHGEMVEIA